MRTWVSDNVFRIQIRIASSGMGAWSGVRSSVFSGFRLQVSGVGWGAKVRGWGFWSQDKGLQALRIWVSDNVFRDEGVVRG